jgi:hypothetical protein
MLYEMETRLRDLYMEVQNHYPRPVQNRVWHVQNELAKLQDSLLNELSKEQVGADIPPNELYRVYRRGRPEGMFLQIPQTTATFDRRMERD